MDEDKDIQKIPKGEISPGDFVRAKLPSHLVDMSPNHLRDVGWPNMFKVFWRGPLFFDKEKREVECISLVECCQFLKLHGSGKFRCNGHPIEFFEKIDVETEEEGGIEKPPHRFSSITTPIGEIANLSYYKGPHDKMVLKLPGMRAVRIDGKIATWLGEKLKEWDWI